MNDFTIKTIVITRTCILRRRTAADALVSGRPADLNGRPD